MNNNTAIKKYFNVDELVLQCARAHERVIEIEPDVYVKVGTSKFRAFKSSGVVCYNCGIEGQYFALEKDKNITGLLSGNVYMKDKRYILNLYAINKRNEKVLMTVDHVIAQGLGGPSKALDNLRTMCSKCNNEKSAVESKICNQTKNKHWSKFGILTVLYGEYGTYV